MLCTSCDKSHDHADSHTHTPYARFASHYLWVEGYPVDFHNTFLVVLLRQVNHFFCTKFTGKQVNPMKNQLIFHRAVI